MEEIACRMGELEHRVRYGLSVLETLLRVHICGWHSIPGMKYEMFVPRYRLGPGRNVPSPVERGQKRPAQSALDYNPGADLQRVTLLWGWASTEETK